MTSPAAWHDQWAQVDQTADPGFFLRFLDTTRRSNIRAANANSRKFFQYLGVQPGHHILEIGCGTGDMLIALAELLGPEGRLVGIDASRTMIDEAARRANRAGASIEFFVGDAQNLDLEPDQFDRCLATCVLEHLESPQQALSELIRVARPGGTLTINEADWDTQVIDADNVEVTRRIVRYYCDSIRHGHMGRELFGLMKRQELSQIRVDAGSLVYMEPDQPLDGWLKECTRRCVHAGVISPSECEQWLEDLVDRGRQGRFFASITLFRATGTKPA